VDSFSRENSRLAEFGLVGRLLGFGLARSERMDEEGDSMTQKARRRLSFGVSFVVSVVLFEFMHSQCQKPDSYAAKGSLLLGAVMSVLAPATPICSRCRILSGSP
jgi:hypothetical protein